MNDQWSGKTLFSCLRIGPASARRSSNHLPSLPCGVRGPSLRRGGAAVVVIGYPQRRVLSWLSKYGRASRTFPEAGADGLLVVRARDEVQPAVLPSLHVDRQFRQAAGRRAEHRLGVLQHLELRLVARAEQAAGLLLVERGRAAGVRADLGERHEDLPLEAGLALAGLDRLARPQPDQQGRRVTGRDAAGHA